ncbi:MAG: STAS domain-containing protein [Taibaiella sp.]|nr:STAS domain-containing protein [Taibaiella sp.]
MDFKIDTRDTFSVITPVSETITANLTDELQATFEKMRQSGSLNFIVDFQECKNIDTAALERLVAMHEECYAMGRSLVFTGTKGKVLAALKDAEIDTIINVAPKMIEAVDIISMEILERDLFGEEQEDA